MAWYWETYIGKAGYWGFIYNDGRYADEIAYIEKEGKSYIAHVSGAVRSFQYLTDAKRYVEKEERGTVTTRKRKETAHPFGL